MNETKCGCLDTEPCSHYKSEATRLQYRIYQSLNNTNLPDYQVIALKSMIDNAINSAYQEGYDKGFEDVY